MNLFKSNKSAVKNGCKYRFILGIVMAVLCIGIIFWFMLKIPVRVVKSMQEIIAYTEGCEVAEGNIRNVEHIYVENSGNKKYDYSLYSAGITYTDQQGTEHNFVSQYYKKKLKYPGKVKVIYDPENPEKQDIAYFEIAVLRYAPYHLNPDLGGAIVSCVIYLFFAAIPFGVAWECYMECRPDKNSKDKLKMENEQNTTESKESKSQTRKEKASERKNDWEMILITRFAALFIIIVLCGINWLWGINIIPFLTYEVTATVDNVEFYKYRDTSDGYVEEYKYEVSYVTQDGEERMGRLYTDGKKYKKGDEMKIVCWDGIKDGIDVSSPSSYKEYVSFVWIFMSIAVGLHVLACLSYYLSYKTLHKPY